MYRKATITLLSLLIAMGSSLSASSTSTNATEASQNAPSNTRTPSVYFHTYFGHNNDYSLNSSYTNVTSIDTAQSQQPQPEQNFNEDDQNKEQSKGAESDGDKATISVLSMEKLTQTPLSATNEGNEPQNVQRGPSSGNKQQDQDNNETNNQSDDIQPDANNDHSQSPVSDTSTTLSDNNNQNSSDAAEVNSPSGNNTLISILNSPFPKSNNEPTSSNHQLMQDNHQQNRQDSPSLNENNPDVVPSDEDSSNLSSTNLVQQNHLPGGIGNPTNNSDDNRSSRPTKSIVIPLLRGGVGTVDQNKQTDNQPQQASNQQTTQPTQTQRNRLFYNHLSYKQLLIGVVIVGIIIIIIAYRGATSTARANKALNAHRSAPLSQPSLSAGQPATTLTPIAGDGNTFKWGLFVVWLLLAILIVRLWVAIRAYKV